MSQQISLSVRLKKTQTYTTHLKKFLQHFQAVFHRGVLRTSDSDEPFSDGDVNYEIPYVFFGIFDGHAGSGCAVAAANELHQVGSLRAIHKCYSTVTCRVFM